jgi:hypothetical protein
MSKLICALVPKGGDNYIYHFNDNESSNKKSFEGNSTIEAITQYLISQNEEFKILLLRPESIEKDQEEKLISELLKYRVPKENIKCVEVPVKGNYESKKFNLNNHTITADITFLAMQDSTDDDIKEIILDVSRGLNFQILVIVDAYRRFLVAQQAKNYIDKAKCPKFYYVYLTPVNLKEKEYEVTFEETKTPFFVDYFKDVNKLPFKFDTEYYQDPLPFYQEFNFIKEIISCVNECISAIKRGFALAFLTIINWNNIEKLLALSYEKLTLKRIKELIETFSIEKDNTKEIKLSMEYSLGKLWIYIYLLETFYKIYKEYENKIEIEEHRKWVKIETLRDFNEKIIKNYFKETSSYTLLDNELENFKKIFKEGNIETKPPSSNQERNFNAHAGLLYEFIDQDYKNYRLSYKLGEILDKDHKRKIEDYVKDYLKAWA